jgi:hypothetical protein
MHNIPSALDRSATNSITRRVIICEWTDAQYIFSTRQSYSKINHAPRDCSVSEQMNNIFMAVYRATGEVITQLPNYYILRMNNKQYIFRTRRDCTIIDHSARDRFEWRGIMYICSTRGAHVANDHAPSDYFVSERLNDISLAVHGGYSRIYYAIV